MNKKLVFFLFAAISTTFLTAQTERAIGIRFGASGEISYQHPLGESNRIEIDLGSSPNTLGGYGIYHWVNDLSSWTEGLSWYYGAGGTVGFSNTSSINPVSKL